MQELHRKIGVFIFCISVIFTIDARKFTPSVAERIIRNGLQEFKKTKAIKNSADFKQAYQDLSVQQKAIYEVDYQDIIDAITPQSIVPVSKSEGKIPTKKIVPIEVETSKVESVPHKMTSVSTYSKDALHHIKLQDEMQKETAKKKQSEIERLEKEKLERERIEKERIIKQQLEEKEKLEQEKVEKERQEQIERERVEQERLEKERKEKENTIIVRNNTQKTIECSIYSCDKHVIRRMLDNWDGIEGNDPICEKLSNTISILAGETANMSYDKAHKIRFRNDFGIPYLLFKTVDNDKAKLTESMTVVHLDSYFGYKKQAIDITDMREYTIEELEKIVPSETQKDKTNEVEQERLENEKKELEKMFIEVEKRQKEAEKKEMELEKMVLSEKLREDGTNQVASEKDIKKLEENVQKEIEEQERLKKELLGQAERERLEKERKEKEEQKKLANTITVHNSTKKDIQCSLYSCDKPVIDRMLNKWNGIEGNDPICEKLSDTISIRAGETANMGYDKTPVMSPSKAQGVPYLLFKTVDNDKAELSDPMTVWNLDYNFGYNKRAIDITNKREYTIKD